jgi:hypothetical protein
MAPRPSDFYELSRHSSDLDAIEAAFPHYLKLRSICWLLRLGIRSPEGIVVANDSELTITAAIDYARSRDWTQFLVRHDSPSGRSRAIQGGFLVGIEELESWVARFVHGGICILLEPFDAIQNGYNLSCLIDQTAAFVEIAGPGFDASDLQRGEIQPHEIRSINLRTRAFGPPTIIGDDAYKQSVIEREQKVWWKFYRRELDRSRWRTLGEAEIADCHRIICQARGAPIPSSYQATSAMILQRYLKGLLPIVTAWREHSQGSTVVASSFVQTGELIFWDVSTDARWIARA